MSFVAIPGSYTGLVNDELIQEEVTFPLSAKNPCGYDITEELSPTLCMSQEIG
jgi:hypothetical protein